VVTEEEAEHSMSIAEQRRAKQGGTD
jgi:hypothetical protein